MSELVAVSCHWFHSRVLTGRTHRCLVSNGGNVLQSEANLTFGEVTFTAAISCRTLTFPGGSCVCPPQMRLCFCLGWKIQQANPNPIFNYCMYAGSGDLFKISILNDTDVISGTQAFLFFFYFYFLFSELISHS